MLQCQCVAEFLQSQAHAVVVVVKEVIAELFHAVSEDQISVIGISFVEGEEYIKMIRSVICISRYQFT
jgi:hypothetical protein